jgi:hypothetical protein
MSRAHRRRWRYRQVSQFLRTLVAGAVWAAVGLAAAIPLFVWGSDKAPEFYGAFTAAIVAAIAVVLGAYYQAELTRRRDDEIARQQRIAEGTDLFLWLEHAIGEMSFIARVLEGFRDDLSDEDKLNMPLDQYREVVSSQFMEELRDRAKSCARLSPLLGIMVAPVLYDTFLAVDRIYRFRGAPGTAQFGRKQIEQHIFVTKHRITKLEEAQGEVEKFLSHSGMPPITLETD